MALIRSQVIVNTTDGAPIDATVHDVYHLEGGILDIIVGGFDWDGHAGNVASAFHNDAPMANVTNFDIYNQRVVEVKCYDMADAKPRPVHGHAIHSPGVNVDHKTQLAPGQVALCLSFYAGRNLPHQRGRLYIGPFRGDFGLTSPVDVGFRTKLLNLGQKLHDIGAANLNWAVYSRTMNAANIISDAWVDDSWDVQRRRKRDATTRDKLHF
jgi:hypothetical protein